MAQLRTFCIGVLLAFATLASAQLTKGDPSRVKIAAPQAVSNARQFLTKAFGATFETRPLSTRLFNPRRAQPLFTIEDKERGLSVHVSAVNGRVRGFYNSRLSNLQFRRIGRTGKLLHDTEAEWKAYLIALGKRLSLPVAGVTNFNWVRESQRKDANRAGRVTCRLMGADGRRLARISVDPQDGTLYHFMDDRDRPQ